MSVDIASLAAKYRKCPSLQILIGGDDNNDWVRLSSAEIRALAAYCLAHHEKPEPSIPTSKLLALLGLRDRKDLVVGLQDLIGEAEKESIK